MKIFGCVILLLSLTGCVTGVKYNLTKHVDGLPLDIPVKDARTNVVQTTNYKYATFTIGERNITPKPVDIVSIKLNKYLSPEVKSSVDVIFLTDFLLVISDPKHAAVLSGAALAGAAYGAGILVQSHLSESADQDGVISKIQIEIDQKTYECINFVPAYDEIGALVGPLVSGKELTKPFDEVIDDCVKVMAETINQKI